MMIGHSSMQDLLASMKNPCWIHQKTLQIMGTGKNIQHAISKTGKQQIWYFHSIFLHANSFS